MRADELISWIKGIGFTDAVIAPIGKVVFRSEFRKACEDNKCGGYGARWTCPPGAGTPEELYARAMTYSHVLFAKISWPLEDCFDFEGIQEGGKEHARLTQITGDQAASRFPEGAVVLGHSRCGLCETCTYPDEPCRHPERAAPGISAYCISVGETARACGLPAYDGDERIVYFTAVLFRDSCHENG